MKHEDQSIVFIIEKPAFARILASLITSRWPSHQVYAVTTMYVGLYEFRYPRGLSIAAFPHVSEPDWKPRAIRRPVWSLTTGEAIQTDLDPAAVINTAQTIYYAADPDASGAVAYKVLLTQCLGAAAAQAERPALYLTSWDDRSVVKALDHPATTADLAFRQWENAGVARRFFDFNYNVNSLALFSACLRDVGVTLPDYGMSKYSLQLLYALQGMPAQTEEQLIALMQGWPGTGRYASAALGSAVSRGPILSGLLDAGLLTKDDDIRIAVADRGHEFLRRLHPDCQDPDLPARLDLWANSWPNSKPKIERYLRTFFGKQKRF